jgi:uncharacterized membrane protein
MRLYVVGTGVVFGLITVAHLWRMVVEPHLARDPWYLFLTAVAAGFSIGAWRVDRRSRSE